MEQFRQFATMLCVSAVGCCAVKLLLPENGLEPVLKTILSIFFLLCLLMPLRGWTLPALGAAPLDEAAAPRTERLTEIYQEQLLRSVEEKVGLVVLTQLEHLGVSSEDAKIFIKVNTGVDGRIDISGIEISLDGGHAADTSELEAALSRELGLDCEVRLAGEGQDDGI